MPRKINIVKILCIAAKKISPLQFRRNIFLMIMYLLAVFSSVILLQSFFVEIGSKPIIFSVFVFLWLSVFIINFAEAFAEEQYLEEAEKIKKSRREIKAKRLDSEERDAHYELISANELRQGDVVLVEAGEMIPGDGEVILGVASVDESAITGESTAVIRESEGEGRYVTSGTRIISDWLVIRISANHGEVFFDRMLSLLESARSSNTSNEKMIKIFLLQISIFSFVVVLTILPVSKLISAENYSGIATDLASLLLLALSFFPIIFSGLAATISISSIRRLIAARVISLSASALETAGDISILLLDKTGTITHGNRQAVALYPADGVTIERLAEAAFFSSIPDETPEGRSIVALVRNKYPYKDMAPKNEPVSGWIEFSESTRISGISNSERQVLKGSGDAIESIVQNLGSHIHHDLQRQAELISKQGGTPLFVAEYAQVLGIIHLKDVTKIGIKPRLEILRRMGVRSIMLTGDNPLTAAAIAVDAGVDDFNAQVTPESKLKIIRKLQAEGEVVAMVGDGNNDAPALAQADIAIAMHSGAQSAKDACNMIDLDSDPTKIIEIVEIAKQMLITRGVFLLFCLISEISKYAILIPAVLVNLNPQLWRLNFLQLNSPQTAIISVVITNIFLLLLLLPVAINGVKYRLQTHMKTLRGNLLFYGIFALLAPLVLVKIIDIFISLIGAF